MVADNKEDLQKTLQECNNFRKHGLRMNLEKTEVMGIGEQEVDLHVVVDGKTIKQVNSFVYMGGTVCEDGGSSKEIQCVRMEEVVRKYRGECKQEQQRGGE